MNLCVTVEGSPRVNALPSSSSSTWPEMSNKSNPVSLLPHLVLWESATKSPFSSHITSRLVTYLKITDAHTQVSVIVDFTVSFKFINFSFQIFLLLVPEISVIFTSYTVEIIYIALVWIL